MWSLGQTGGFTPGTLFFSNIRTTQTSVTTRIIYKHVCCITCFIIIVKKTTQKNKQQLTLSKARYKPSTPRLYPLSSIRLGSVRLLPSAVCNCSITTSHRALLALPVLCMSNVVNNCSANLT